MNDASGAEPDRIPHDPGNATSPTTAVRRDLALAGHRGDVELPRAHLHDSDPHTRAAALAALARSGALDDDELGGALRDHDAVVRRRAAELAARHRGEVADLAGLLDDPDPRVVEMAAFALGERRASDPVVRALSRVAGDHDDALCRESAVAALGALGDPAGAPAVLDACHDRAAVRRRAVLALAAFEGPEVRAALERLSQDRDLQVRQAAEDLLAIEDDGSDDGGGCSGTG
jgi:HEAT repeat protein